MISATFFKTVQGKNRGAKGERKRRKKIEEEEGKGKESEKERDGEKKLM